MARPLPHPLYLLVIFFCLLGQRASAQANTAYTSGNTILVTLEGITRPFTFTSDNLLVNYNQTTQKLECILNVSTLVPAGDSVAPPATMAYEVLYGAKFPALYLEIDVPLEQLNGRGVQQEPLPLVTKVRLQGVANETVIPVVFAPDKQAPVFSTNFDLLLDNFEASIPIKYAPLLTGRIFITIRSARWANLQMR